MIGTKLLTAAALTLLAATALPAAAKADGYCREYTRSVFIGGRPHEAYGTACLGPDGAWRIASENLGVRHAGAPVVESNMILVDGQPVIPQPAPQPVQYVTPYAPYPQPVYAQPVYAQPVYYYQPTPVISFGFYGGHHHWH